MNARVIVMLGGCALLCMGLSSSAQAEELEWLSAEGPPVAWWGLRPTQPVEGEGIRYRARTADEANSCLAQASMGGSAVLSVDSSRETVELAFVPPAPEVCPLLWDPVQGVECAFGPLAAGEWVFSMRSPHPLYQWDDPFTVLPRPAPGDATADGIVGIADLSLLAGNYGRTDMGFLGGDFNGDGVVGIADLAALADTYTSSTVPEPSSMALLTLAAATFVRRRRG